MNTVIEYILRTHLNPRIPIYLYRYMGSEELDTLVNTGWIRSKGSGVFKGVCFTSNLSSIVWVAKYGVTPIKTKLVNLREKVLPVFYVHPSIDRTVYEEILRFYGELVNHPTFYYENLRDIDGDGFIQHQHFSKENEWRAWNDVYLGRKHKLVRE